MPTKTIAPGLAVLYLAAAQLFVGAAFACKTRAYPEQFPLNELAAYEHAYVIRVGTIDWVSPPEVGRYAPAFACEGKIERSLKGPKHAGDVIRATTSINEAHAVCPIYLEAGKTYLLLLNGTTSPYVLPRYGSLFVSSDDRLFASYLETIARAGKTTEAR